MKDTTGGLCPYTFFLLGLFEVRIATELLASVKGWILNHRQMFCMVSRNHWRRACVCRIHCHRYDGRHRLSWSWATKSWSHINGWSVLYVYQAEWHLVLDVFWGKRWCPHPTLPISTTILTNTRSCWNSLELLEGYQSYSIVVPHQVLVKNLNPWLSAVLIPCHFIASKKWSNTLVPGYRGYL